MSESSSSLTAVYRVVTPMFLSGADQTAAELRLPSFKGALRFWWRALATERDIKRLREAEDQLFGSTRSVSRVRMRLVQTEIRTKRAQKVSPNTWKSYTGYGLTEKGERDYIEPGSVFGVRFDGALCDEAGRKQLSDALIALGLAGGLGSRARNGWGSVTLILLKDAEGNVLWQAPPDAAALRNELQRRFNNNATLADWTAFSKESVFAIGPDVNAQEQAHQWLAERYREAMNGLSETKSHREGFGLPRKNAGQNAGRRRAGATFLHVHQAANDGPATPVALCLPACFLDKQDAPAGGWQTGQGFVKGLVAP